MQGDQVDPERFERLRSSLNQNSLEFLNTDIDTAFTMVELALNAYPGSEKRARNTSNARRAYDTIVRLARRVDVSPEQARLLDGKLERLKHALQTLGETF